MNSQPKSDRSLLLSYKNSKHEVDRVYKYDLCQKLWHRKHFPNQDLLWEKMITIHHIQNGSVTTLSSASIIAPMTTNKSSCFSSETYKHGFLSLTDFLVGFSSAAFNAFISRQPGSQYDSFFSSKVSYLA